MVQIRFTSHLARHRQTPVLEARSGPLSGVLSAALAGDPLLRSYILDEQGRLRKHVNIFINGSPVADRLRLGDPVPDGAEVYVMQALSGG